MSSSDEQIVTPISETEALARAASQPQEDQSRPPTEHDENDPDPKSSSTPSSDGRVNGMEKMLEEEGDESPGAGSSGEVNGGARSGVVELVEVTEHAGDDSGQWSDDDSHELKRVKVYQLIANRWVDQGTAFCFGDLQDGEALLVARAEMDFNHIILSTVIRGSDVYQRQQDTLIVWTEPDGNDYALSFQDPDGCGEVWQFIQEVQRHMNNGDGLSSSPLMGSDQSITTASIIRSGHLPQPQLGIIGEIEKAIKTLARTNAMKERICEYVQTEEYIKSMIDVYHQAEDLESLENLHALCSCMQAILMLNDHSLYEHILEDNLFFGVVGMLEYDPEFPTYKANYRDFLNQMSRFHQPIPLGDEAIQKKVHHTYRLQFLKDVVLARAIDDSTFNVLNSCIIFNQIDIINHVQNDPNFLRDVVAIFMDDDLLAALGLPPRNKEPERDKPTEKDLDKMDVDQPEVKLNGHSATNGAPGSTPYDPDMDEHHRRHEVILLIQQLCVMGKNVQLPARMALFRQLVDRGILFAVQWALAQPETEEQGKQMIAASGEILTALLDHDLNGVRGHVLKQINAMEREKASGKKIVEKETVLALMCRILVKSRDLAVQSQIGEALKTLLEIQPDTPDQHTPMNTKMLQRAKDDPGVEKFMDYFYKTCVETLFRPFGDVPEFKNVTGELGSMSRDSYFCSLTRIDPVLLLSRERTNLFLYLCDLLAMFTLQHSFRSHFFILSSNITPRVASLLKARDKHLRLAAFRYFRACLKLNNSNLFRHLIKHDSFKPVLDLTLEESRRDNLLSASCQEFFENIRKDNVKILIEHIMARHAREIRELATMPSGDRFQMFIRRHEMNIEPPPAEQKAEKLAVDAPRRWGQGKLLEAEEEEWFNGDDDEGETGAVYKIPPKDDDDAIEIGPPVSTPPKSNLKRKRGRGLQPTRSVRQPFGGLQRTSPLGTLLDYDENEDDTGGVAPSHASPLESSPSLPRTASISSGYFPLSVSSKGPPPSPPVLPTFPTKPSAPPSSGDEQDDLLESLYQKPGSSSAMPPVLPELGVKRRREEEDDELLERLASRGKRASVGPSAEKEKENADSPTAGKAGLVKPVEEAPKKIKLKIGSVGAAVASGSPSTSAPPSPSSTGTKDGDNG